MRFAMHIVCGAASGARRRAPRIPGRLSRSPTSTYLCVGDIRAIVN
jgi:hypothetical protein